jgi:hypothetical protein
MLCVAMLLVLAPAKSFHTKAQSSRPVLISEDSSTRAVAVDSVTRKHEPFSPTSEVSFGTDNHTRVMLFAMGIDSAAAASDVTASAEDGAHNLYALPVEFVGPVSGQEWMTSIIVRLSDTMTDVGDVLVGISHQGVSSNRVRVAMGHVGDGPPDDQGAVPTPGSGGAPPPPPSATTAGTLTTGEVQTVIAQAVSAASSLNRAVTVAVADKEGNVLGVFAMTSAPATTQLRGGGPGHRIRIDRFRWNGCSGEAGSDFESRHGCFVQHARQRVHFPHREFHHPGTFSAGHRQSRGRTALRRAGLFTALFGHQDSRLATRSKWRSGQRADLQKR